MGDQTGISWTESTWNPIRGCIRVSPGCGGPGPHGGCYAEGIAARFSGPGQPYEGLAEFRGGKPRWIGKLAFVEQALTLPLRWKRPRRIFVNSMSDLFHESVPDEWIDRVFAVMALAPQHSFQVLTKRSARMREYMQPEARMKLWAGWVTKAMDRGERPPAWPLPNVWMGVSAEDQRRADERVPDLLATPAAVRFVSAEPLLLGIDFRWALASPLQIASGFLARGHFAPGLETLRRLDWIIVGGESGPNARPMHPAWARSIRDQCAAAGVAFHFKQWGEYRPLGAIHDLDNVTCNALIDADENRSLILCEDGREWPDEDGQPPDHAWMVERVGKTRAGRLLDGVQHDGFPEVRA